MEGGHQFITTAISSGYSDWLLRDLISCGFSKRDKLEGTSAMKDSKVTQREKKSDWGKRLGSLVELLFNKFRFTHKD
jgi:hypothetical protein